MILTIKNLDESSFAKYGTILRFTHGEDNFQVKVQENLATGWRVALLKVNAKTIDRVSCHPNTMETFEPLEGTVVLIVAEYDRPGEQEAFLLDKSVCVNKSVWHNMLALSEVAIVKITENVTVKNEIFALTKELKAGLVEK